MTAVADVKRVLEAVMQDARALDLPGADADVYAVRVTSGSVELHTASSADMVPSWIPQQGFGNIGKPAEAYASLVGVHSALMAVANAQGVEVQR